VNCCERVSCSLPPAHRVTLIRRDDSRTVRDLCAEHKADEMDLVREPWTREGWSRRLRPAEIA
jgi:hypothetical protein